MQDREECVNSPFIRHLIQNSGKNSFLSLKLSAHLKSLRGIFFFCINFNRRIWAIAFTCKH